MSLKKNVIGLAIAQIFNYVLPLVQLPYLSRVLDQEKFGSVVFILSLMMITNTITDYGLDLSATKAISENKNKDDVNRFIYESFVIKSLLLIPSCLIFIIGVLSSNEEASITIIAFGLVSVLLNAFNKRWLFLSLEKTYIFSQFVIASRIVGTGLVFALIKTNSDYELYTLIFSIQAFILTVGTNYIIRFNYDFKPVKTSFSSALLTMKNGGWFFASRMGSTAYVSGCTAFLGWSSGMSQVSIYGTAEKLHVAGVGVFVPVISSLTPYMNRTKNYNLLFKIALIIFSIGIVGVAFGYYFGEEIIRILFGDGFSESKKVLDIFLITIMTSSLGMLFGHPALMPIGLERHANLSLIYGGFLQLLLFSLLLLFNSSISAVDVALCYLCCDSFMLLQRLLVLFRNRHLINECK
ncbi:oligosaccharide flippase family protein [Enterovibrio baiacu]|uniref:oligosaccharide flippase family protein n=1 Tax=Enterovibrio baiacu TaxID=2491023 RepID=UPI003D10768A